MSASGVGGFRLISSTDCRRRLLEAAQNAHLRNVGHGVILNHMVQYHQTHFSASFAALADDTRRGVLEQLAQADASITDLADRFDMTLTGMKKHVGVLEVAGLVTTEKVGRVRTCRIGPSRLEAEMEWISRYREVWDARFDALDRVVDELKRNDKLRSRHQQSRKP